MIFLELRDRATYIPVVAIKIIPPTNNAARLYYRAGHELSNPPIALIRLDTNEGWSDPYEWGNARTMTQAHLYIQENYDKLSNGDVIDVEFILGETTTKKEPQ